MNNRGRKLREKFYLSIIKKNKILRELTKQVKYLYAENYKALLKFKDVNKLEGILYSSELEDLIF